MSINTEHVAAEFNQLMAQATPLDFDADFAQYLNQKRVALIGPAETIIGTNLGPTIESYDVIVRFNGAFEFMPFVAELAADIGKRTDIIYLNYQVIYEILDQTEMTHERFFSICHEAGIKYIICPNNNLSYLRNGEAAPHCVTEQVDRMLAFQQFLKDNGSNIKFRMLYTTTETFNRWIAGYIGRTGAIAILDVLSHTIDELFIRGMTFYHRGGHLFQKGNWELHPMAGPEGVIPTGPESHNSYLELDLMKLLVAHQGHKIQLDHSLSSLLNSKST